MTQNIDLDAYFRRIEWGDKTSPSLDTLAGLMRAHMAHIPFENLDVLLGRPVRLDLEGLQNKLVRAGRGGYCFEHATLFAAVLEALGFKPMHQAARVVLFAPRTAAPRTHMFLTMPVDGATYVVDPGFGSSAPRVPLPLVDGDAHAQSETHRMVREGDLWVLHVARGGQPVPGWVAVLNSENLVDFEMANHFVATHPTSPFVNAMMLSVVTPDGRINVMNRDVTMIRGNDASASQLADRAALRALLAEHFGFDMPEIERLRVPAIPEWQ